MYIRTLTPDDAPLIEQIATFLGPCFARFAPTWLPDRQACLEEIAESFDAGRRSRVLVDDHGRARGWIGAIEGRHVWEIHPIAVDPTAHRSGHGRRLVDDITALARAHGAVSVWAGTSDETQDTTLSGIDLYADAGAAFRALDGADGHPIHFWRGIGFTLVGVMPDEEGLGKPGIHFAKRIVTG